MVARLLYDGWRVVVPWIVESELERLPEREENLELVKADLFDPGAVSEVVSRGAADAGRPLRGLVNLVGGFAVGGRVDVTPIEDFEKQFRLNLRPTYLMVQAAAPRMIEAKNSAAIAALELYWTGARVTLVHRRSGISNRVKYWIKPNIENRINNGEIQAYFHSRVTEIRPESRATACSRGRTRKARR